MLLTNIATATQANRTSVALLTNTIVDLTTQVTYFATKFQQRNRRTLISTDPDIFCPTQVPYLILIHPSTEIFIRKVEKVQPQ